MDYRDYPRAVVEDIVRLRRRIEQAQLPGKRTDQNLLVGTWNIQHFGRLHDVWEENSSSPKRNLRALAYIAEVVRRMDVVAIQEVKRETTAIRTLVNDYLGPDWGLLLSDVTAGTAGNTERLAFIFDKRRVQPSGLAGEIALPATESGEAVSQFARTPYIVGFQSGGERFALLTAHIDYGDVADDRLPELEAMAQFVAAEIRDRTESGRGEESNLIVLGDFNIDRRGDNPLFKAFISTGLIVPKQLLNLKTTYGTDAKHYDQIAWFMGDLELNFNQRAGVIDFAGAVYQDISLRSMSFRVSDHFPVWVEFIIDRSVEQMAVTLGVDPEMPDPLGTVSE